MAAEATSSTGRAYNRVVVLGEWTNRSRIAVRQGIVTGQSAFWIGNASLERGFSADRPCRKNRCHGCLPGCHSPRRYEITSLVRRKLWAATPICEDLIRHLGPLNQGILDPRKRAIRALPL